MSETIKITLTFGPEIGQRVLFCDAWFRSGESRTFKAVKYEDFGPELIPSNDGRLTVEGVEVARRGSIDYPMFAGRVMTSPDDFGTAPCGTKILHVLHPVCEEDVDHAAEGVCTTKDGITISWEIIEELK
jgi:hypothetical protein